MTLPNITVKTDCDNRLFLKRMYRILKNDKYVFNLTHSTDEIVKGEDSLKFSTNILKEHKDLGTLIYNDNSIIDRVFIEIFSNNWNMQYPNYSEYANTAKVIIRPPLKEYNQKHNTKIRLSIPSVSSLIPKLPKAANSYFNYFIEHKYSQKMYPTDWKNFDKFTHHCISKNVDLEREDLHHLLLVNDIDNKIARLLCDSYARIKQYSKNVK